MRASELPESDREFLRQEFEEPGLLAGCVSQLRRDLHHGADDVFVPELGELAIASRVVERWDLGHDVAAPVAESRVLQSREGIGRALRGILDGEVVVRSPGCVDRGPFLFSQLVGLGGCTVVLPCSDKVSGVMTSSQVPVGP